MFQSFLRVLKWKCYSRTPRVSTFFDNETWRFENCYIVYVKNRICSKIGNLRSPTIFKKILAKLENLLEWFSTYTHHLDCLSIWIVSTINIFFLLNSVQWQQPLQKMQVQYGAVQTLRKDIRWSVLIMQVI